MLTPQTAIWISPKNVLSLHCTGVALQQTRGHSGAFWVVHGHSAGAEGPSQTALGKNYKALGKNYKGDSFIYLPDKFAQAVFWWRKPVAELFSKVINVNATMHFGIANSPLQAYCKPTILQAGAWSGTPKRPARNHDANTGYFASISLAKVRLFCHHPIQLFHLRQVQRHGIPYPIHRKSVHFISFHAIMESGR